MYTRLEIKKLLTYYVRSGFIVIPLYGVIWDEESGKGTCTCGKADCEKPGKHPMMSWKHLGDDPLPIGKLHAMVDNAEHLPNWGLMTGAETGAFVVDIDVKSGGLDTIDKLGLTIPSGWPETVICETGSGGWHVYLRWQEGQSIKNAVNLAPGIDIRGYNGFVVAPPSRHVNGNYYKWFVRPQDVAFADINYAALLDTLEKYKDSLTPAGKGKSNTYTMVMSSVTEGDRNNQMTKLAGRYLGMGMTDEEALIILRHINITKFEPPLPELELHTVVSSIRRSEGSVNEVDPEDMKASIVTWLGLNKTISDDKQEITLKDIYKITGTDPKYKFVFQHGENEIEVKMPSGSLHSPPTFTRVMADTLMRVPRQLGGKTMPTHAMLLNYILAVAETVNSGEEGTEEGESMVFIRQYLMTENVSVLPDDGRCAPRGPFKTSTHYYLNLQEFTRWLMLQSSNRLSMQTLAQTLSAFHCSRKTFYTEAGTSRTMWGVSHELVTERGV